MNCRYPDHDCNNRGPDRTCLRDGDPGNYCPGEPVYTIIPDDTDNSEPDDWMDDF